MNRMNGGEVIRRGILDMQVCVPTGWSDEQIVEFATAAHAELGDGWKIRDEPELLAGCPVRNPCSQRCGNVHITLDTLRIGAAHQPAAGE